MCLQSFKLNKMESQRDKFLMEVTEYLKDKTLVQYRDNPKVVKYFSDLHYKYVSKKKPTLTRRLKYLITGKL